MLSHIMSFLETGRNFSVSMTTKLTCSPSWKLELESLSLERKLSAPIMPKFFLLHPEIHAPCKHEERDTCILLHLEDTVKEEYTKASLHTVDIDMLGCYHLNTTELWVMFGTGKGYRHLHVAAREMAKTLGRERCKALPISHTYTGCDILSFYCGQGKKTTRDTWMNLDNVNSAFCALAATPDVSAIDAWMEPVE